MAESKLLNTLKGGNDHNFKYKLFNSKEFCCNVTDLIEEYLNTHSITSILFAATCADLPPANTQTDKIWGVLNDTGTKWLPSWIGGGDYCPHGLYYSDGVNWIYLGVFSLNATQAEVDAGVITDKFVSPSTFANAAKWNTKNSSIQFKDEGVNLGTSGTVNSIDFVGTGATVSRIGNSITISIPGTTLVDGDYGDVTISGGGTVITIDNGLSATVLADGSVSNTEFQYINSLTSNAQDQIDTKIETNLAIALAVAL